MPNRTQDYFNEAYRTGVTPWARADIGAGGGNKFVKLCRAEKVGRTLDLGCGDGKFAIFLAQTGFESYGIDFASEAIKQAKKKAKSLGLSRQTHFRVGDVLKLPYPRNFFGGVVDFGCLHHIKKGDWQKYLRGLVRVLGKGGLFFLTAFSKNTAAHYNLNPLSSKRSWNVHKEPIGIDHYDYFFNQGEIKNLFEDYFHILEIVEEESGPTKQRVFQVLMKKL